jgi:protease YdgD
MPGVGARDPRVEVDAAEAPWRSLGKLQATAGGMRSVCTATLVAADKVLTAAHCLYNRRTESFFLPSSMHFLLAYARGQHEAHGRVVRFTTGSDYDPASPGRSRGSDWAVLTLDPQDPMPDAVLPIRIAPPAPGTIIAIGGYSQDRGFTITADRDCRIVALVADASGRRLLRHDCAATRGVSGAPVLMLEGSEWRVVGINVAAARDGPGGVATTLQEARKAF